MKILQVCPQYYPTIGGLEEHVKNISERLAEKHEVVVYTGDPSGRLLKEDEIGGVRIRRFKTFAPGNAYHISFKMAQELSNAEFDIAHGHGYHALPLYFSRNARAKKFVVTPHYHGYGHTPFRNLLIKLYKPFGNSIFKHADQIIANSSFEKKQLIKDFKLKESSINVINPGINLAEYAMFNSVQMESTTILYVGRLEEYKGIQHIIRTLPLLNKAFHLEVVGMGQYKTSLMAQVDKLGLNGRVKFYQDLSRQELLKMYARAGIFVLLSQHESFSIVVAETLASKTPCIVANTSALSEWIDNKNCFGINYPINSAELARLITEVIGKKVSAVKLWDWDEVTQRIAELYKKKLN